MKNYEKIYDYLQKESVVGEYINYSKENIYKKWRSKHYICYSDYCNEWFLFMKNTSTRRIKKLMKLVKNSYEHCMKDKIINYYFDSYEEYETYKPYLMAIGLMVINLIALAIIDIFV